jgi:hypothetical protein
MHIDNEKGRRQCAPPFTFLFACRQPVPLPRVAPFTPPLRRSSGTQPTLRQGLLHAADGTPACHHADAGTLRRVPEGLHDVMPKEIGKQNDQLRAGGQLQAPFLMRGITPADVMRDRDVVPFQQIRDVAQAIRTHYHCAQCRRHDVPHCVVDRELMIMILVCLGK